MGLDLRIQQRLSQSLVMTPQLQQAIKLLQLSHVELATTLRDELEQNPVLEEHGDGAAEPPEPDGELHQEALAALPMDLSPVEASAAKVGDDGYFGDSGGDGDGSDGSRRDDGDGDGDGRGDGDGDGPLLLGDEGGRLGEPAGASQPSEAEVRGEVDWDAYQDSHSFSAPSGSGAGGDELPPLEASYCRGTSLHEHLRWQLQMAALEPEVVALGELLIDAINDDGYLAEGAVAEAARLGGRSEADALLALRAIQELEPLGVGARSLRECLEIQARRQARACPLVEAILADHLHHVERRNLGAIARELGVTQDAVRDAVRAIARLEPRPGRAFSAREAQYITPDIYVQRVGEGFAIALNDEGLPRLRIADTYRDTMAHSGGATRAYLQDKMRAAAWLLRSVQMRQRTIYRVMESIVKFQRGFFERGVGALRPLILKDVAEDVNMHESTISRVTTNKFVHTPQGIYELKFFFNSSIQCGDGDSVASESVRSHIERLVGSEDPAAPLSDQRIVVLLKQREIDIARRTVAKYRDMLKIPSSSRRRRVF